MVQIPRWKVILILAVCALSFLYSAPNVMSKPVQQILYNYVPSWLPTKTVNLGLDLQGGSHLLLQADLNAVMKERADDLVSTLRPELRDKKIGYTRIGAIPGGVRVTLRDTADASSVRAALRDLDNTLEIKEEADRVEATFSDTALKEMKNQVIDQSIEIVRRRIDETGTNEPVIQRQGEDRILVQLPGLDDPKRVKELLGTTAKLTFHLVDQGFEGQERGNASTMLLPMAEDPLQTIAIERKPRLTGDTLTNAQFAQDQSGQPAVSFRFNSAGTKKFCALSRENVGKLFAIVLDGKVISAPVIREPICGGSGQISGAFSVKEASDLALLLRAGALPAPLSILEERTVGPSLGADSIEAGKKASLIALILVFAFTIAAYGLFGVFACTALTVNLAMLMAVMSGLQATLTLPGIAGIVLTIAMAVDSNVLIFERIREEMRSGRSVISAIDSGFRQAMGTIIDSNLTTLIAAIILFSFGTGPIKGFAVTMGIGIVTSFFTAIMVTRLLVVWWMKAKKGEALPI